MRLLSMIPLLLALSGPASAAPALPANRPIPGYVRVRIDTSFGPITVALDARRAPATTANFLDYVDDGRFEGTTFYRAARRKASPTHGLIQGGIDTDLRRSLPPVRHEPTSQTGIRHLDATISMARPDRPNSATGNFSITVGPTPNLDAQGAYIGYAAFGHVVAGMDVVGRILAQPSCCGTGPMRGQMIIKPVTILRAVRLDGKAKPPARIRPWLLQLRPRPKS